MLQEAVNDNQRVMTLINTLSGTLRNIDAEFEYELARARSTAKPDIRPVVMETVRRRYQQRREPYVQKLAELRSRVKTAEARA